MGRNILIALSGTIVAQLINIIATLFLVKIISPSLFGQFVVWVSYLGIFTVALSLRLEIALTNESTDEGRKRLIAVILKYTSFTSLILTFLLLIIYYFNFLKIDFEYLFIFLGSFLSVCFQVTQNYFALSGNLKKLNIIRILNVASFSILQIFFVYLWNNIIALCLGYILGFLISLLIGGRGIYLDAILKIKKVSFITEVKQHKNYLKYSLPADLINVISASMPLIIVENKFGTAAAGTLGLAFRFLAAPVALLSKAVLDIYKKEAALNYYKFGEFREVYIKTLKILVISSIIIAGSIILFSEYVIDLLLDESWVNVSGILIVLTPLFCIRFIASPLSYAVYIANMQKIDLVFQVVMILVTFTVLNFSSEYIQSLIYYSYGLALLYIIYIGISFKLSKGVKE